MSDAPSRRMPSLALALALPGLAIAAGRAAAVNSPTAGFLLLISVLGVAARGDLVASVVASVVAALGYNYFFLPPFFTLTISEPANWAAFGTFLATSVVTSRLVWTARRRAEEAEQRRRETETLYELCFGLFAASSRGDALAAEAGRTLSALGATRGAVILADGAERRAVYALGERAEIADDPAIAAALESATPRELAGGGAAVPIDVGGRLIGVLVARGTSASTRVVVSAARLLGLAIERRDLLEAAARSEAIAASDRLKTALLRAVSHDLRTPLTAMALDLEALARDTAAGSPLRSRAEAAARERERLERRIGNLLSAARAEAGLLRPRPEPIPAGELLAAARENLSHLLAGIEVRTRIAGDCPEVLVDPSLAIEILVNLLENAARVQPPGVALECEVSPSGGERVAVAILDRGPGPPAEPRGGAAGDPGESGRPGLGLAIARQLALASGGRVVLGPRDGGGTRACLELPGSRLGAADGGDAEVER
ncbi:MAG: DUF4118 domain-containing protein [Thermoanaerobaculia bacterium]